MAIITVGTRTSDLITPYLQRRIFTIWGHSILLITLFILFIATYLYLRYINQKHIRSYSLTDFIPQGL
nr:MAG TPA: hypothetical protein [Crassvirales sp.]